MPLEIRRATVDDAPALATLGHEAYGHPTEQPPYPAPCTDARTTWVAVEGGDVLGAAAHHRYDSWWWGELVPTCGVADVKVAPEARGRGVMRAVLSRLLESARDEGAVLSTLFPTAPGIYRGLGFEVVTTYDEVEIPTGTLGAGATSRHRTRRAGAADLPLMREVYGDWARTVNGPLSRTGPMFPDRPNFGDVQVTLAVDGADRPRGVMVWDRTGGYSEPGSTLRVHDLIGLDPDATLALLRDASTHASVAPRALFSTSGTDPVRMHLPQWAGRTVKARPYMLAVLDVAKAIEARAYPRALSAATTVAVDGTTWHVTVEGGHATAVPTDEHPTVRFTRRGFASVWSGAASLASTVAVGQADGADDFWSLVSDARGVQVRDYF